MNLLLVMLGGGLGEVSRYLLGGWLHAQPGNGFPWGTFAVNAPGSLMIGLVFGLAGRGSLPPAATLFLTVGASLLKVARQFAVGPVAVYAGFVAIRGLADV